TPNRPVFNANRILNKKIEDSLFNLSVIKENYLKNKFTEGGAPVYVYGLIADIIYVHFGSINADFSILSRILQSYSEAKGLIVDLRHNPGGDFTYSFPELGQLTRQKILVFSSRTKNGPGKNDFTPWYQWYIEPKGTYFSKKVVLLTDRYTVSAAERTALAFKAMPGVTLIGEPTSGALSTMIGRELANGWYYTLSTQQVKAFNGAFYEGKGVPPDIVVKNTLQEISAGKDRVLETALQRF
ncbi:MAG: S41 family peptidase, partial [Flavisolibacter sp.]|nr:S41 family peptidase [Flavisolibacter sp.]